MFHATSARLARLARHIRDRRLLHDQAVAAVNGWQVQRIAAATYRYHDPRFTTRHRQDPRSPAPVGGDRHA